MSALGNAVTSDAISIIEVGVDDRSHLDSVRTLIREYGEFLGPDHLCAADLERELVSLPGRYALPGGALLLATTTTRAPLGCVGLRGIRGLDGQSAGEVKRLWVRPSARGHQTGSLLLRGAIDRAPHIGYDTLFLDTIPSLMSAAVALYRRFGFVDCAPYNRNSGPLIQHMKLKL